MSAYVTVQPDDTDAPAARVLLAQGSRLITVVKLADGFELIVGTDYALALAAEITRVHRNHQDGGIQR